MKECICHFVKLQIHPFISKECSLTQISHVWWAGGWLRYTIVIWIDSWKLIKHNTCDVLWFTCIIILHTCTTVIIILYDWLQCKARRLFTWQISRYCIVGFAEQINLLIVTSDLKDPIWHSLELQIGFFSSEATLWYTLMKIIQIYAHIIIIISYTTYILV